MKDKKAGSSSRDEFNDSDDAFVFKSPNMKRKMKPVSPKILKRKVPEKTALSKSVSTQSTKAPRNKILNISAPVTSVKKSSTNDKGLKTLSPYFIKNEKAEEPKHSETERGQTEVPENVSSPAKVTDENEPEMVDLSKNSLPSSSSFDLISSKHTDTHVSVEGSSPKKSSWENFPLLKNPAKIESFVCPLCQKKFEKSSQHVSHIKQCAKKKKIPTSELVRLVEGSKPGYSSSANQADIRKERAVPEKESDASEDMALAAALSLSMSESNRPGTSAIDKKILDSQRSTLERYGFTSTSNATGPRRRKIKRVGTPTLTTRTAEERTRLLTEKAAVILLSQQESCFQRKKPVTDGDSQISSQFPYVAQDNKLWDLGEAEHTGTWYLQEMKPYISPEKYVYRPVTHLPEKSAPECELEIEQPLAPTKVNPEETRGCSLAEDWARLVGSKELSDAVVETLDSQVAVHSLVLAVRCPGVTAAQLAAPCLTMSSTTLLDTLRFIYTGIWKPTITCDLDDALTIARVLGRKDLVEIISHELSSEIVPATPKPEGGGFEIDFGSRNGNLGAENVEKDEDMECYVETQSIIVSSDPMETADTVPVEEVCESTQRQVSELVDLTLFGSGSSTDSNGDEKNPMTQSKQPEFEVNPRTQSPQPESGVNGKIPVISQMLTSQHSVLRHTADKETQSFSLSQRECIDLFDDEIEDIPNKTVETLPVNEIRSGVIKFTPSQHRLSQSSVEFSSADDDVRIVSAPAKSTAEVICLSDSDQNEPFDGPKSDVVSQETTLSKPDSPAPSISSQKLHEMTPHSRSQPQYEEPPSIPYMNEMSFWEPPENDVNDAVIDYPISPSQNLVVAVEPRTPRKVLESPLLQSNAKSPDSLKLGASPKDSTPKSSAWSELTCRRMRKSIAKNKISWSSRSSIIGRRNSRIGCRKTPRAAIEAVLSESVINALDEPFFDEEVTASAPEPSVRTPFTPCLENRPFVEITPCMTPSTRMVDNPSPRPSFSAMKTGSIKKHLQRYGLKKSLSKVKARKILKHFYEELHPVVNTATGKLVKFLPKEEIAARGGKGKARGGKASARGRVKAGMGSEPVASTSSTIVDTKPSTSKEMDVGADLENVTSESTDSGDESDASGVEEEDFDFGEDDIQSQAFSTTMTVREAIRKYVYDHEDVHLDILRYKPVWLETFRKNLQEYLKVKFKLNDIMDCLDDLCIAFRSEAQAASNQKRNARKAARRKKAPARPRKKS